MRFGVHCSLKYGLSGALDEAVKLGCEAMQIFTRSPRMWKMKPPPDEEIAEFNKKRESLRLFPLVVHTPYLPNLATAKKTLYDLSLGLMKEDLKLAGKLNADYYVIHPGSYSEGFTLKDGIAGIRGALNEVMADSEDKTVILIENVAGGGRRVGSSFNELAEIIQGVKKQGRVGVCLDTAHACGSGYDLSRKSGVEKMAGDFDRAVGMEYLKVMHINDSKAECASRKDRHEHLGKGHIGEKGMRYLVKRFEKVSAAGIIETPKEPKNSDKKNLSLLFKWRGKGTQC